jgi:RNA methyltransferase, TrmH family
VLEGFHALKHAIRFGAALEEVASADPEALGRLAEALAPDVAGELSALARPVPAELFARLAPVPPGTGVIGLARRPRPGPLPMDGPAPIVLLDRPTHPGNVGAVVRVAAAAGAAAVATTGPLDPWQPAALRGSAGLHYALPVLRLDRPPETGRPLVALDPDGDALDPAAVPPGALLAFGTERAGLSGEVRALAGRRLAIPMRPGVSSLNLATAVAVVLYALPRRR